MNTFYAKNLKNLHYFSLILFKTNDVFKIEACEPHKIESLKGNLSHIYCDYLDLTKSVEVGGKVFLDDGFL